MILVTGATGNVGGAVAAALSERGVPHRGLVRRPDADLPAGTEPVVGDLGAPDTLDGALGGVTGLFLLAGYDGTDETLARAKAAGATRVALLSSSSLTATRTDNAIAQYHADAERAVRESGLDWTFLRPNSFTANTRDWLPQLREGDTVRLRFPDVAVAMVDPRDIADVVVAALTEDGHAGATYRLTGPEALTPAQRLAVLGGVLGRDLTGVPLTREQTHAELAEDLPEQYASAIEQFFGDRTVDETTVIDDVPRITGHPARTYEQWCRDHAADFA